MNKQRRHEISKVIEQLNILKTELEHIKDDEEFTFDNMPENLQGSMRGSNSEDAIDCMDEALESINSALDSLGDIM